MGWIRNIEAYDKWVEAKREEWEREHPLRVKISRWFKKG